MYVFLHWELLSFSLSIFTTVVHLCMPQEPIRNWKCGNENVRKKLCNILSLTQRWTMLLTLWRALESLITQLRKHNTEICAEEASALEFKFRFPLTRMLFLGIFLRCFVPVWLSRSHSDERAEINLFFTQHNRSIRLQNVNSFQGLCYAHWVTCVLSSSFVGCKIAR